MAINIQQIVFLHQVGKRKNNEDSIFPFEGATNVATDRLFMVCDGVGGANKGEVASYMVCLGFQQYFEQQPPQNVDAAYLTAALRFVESKLSAYIAEHPECSGMATTLTLLYLDDKLNKATIAWCGDSRIYQVRKGEIVQTTSDHSLVNELVKRGELTAQEATTHPQRNVILRAISGADNPTKIDVVETTDMQAGDYFFMCSDGILESIDDRMLSTLLINENVDLEERRDLINELCAISSHDNFSMYLLRLGDIIPNATEIPSLPTTKLTQTGEVDTTPIEKKVSKTQPDTINRKFIYLLLGTVAVLLLALSFYKWQQSNDRKEYNELVQQAQTKAEQGDVQGAITSYQNLQHDFPHYSDSLQIKIDDLKQLLADQAANQWRDSLRVVFNDRWATDPTIVKRLKYDSLKLQELVLLSDTARIDSFMFKFDSLKNLTKTPPPPAPKLATPKDTTQKQNPK